VCVLVLRLLDMFACGERYKTVIFLIIKTYSREGRNEEDRVSPTQIYYILISFVVVGCTYNNINYKKKSFV